MKDKIVELKEENKIITLQRCLYLDYRGAKYVNKITLDAIDKAVKLTEERMRVEFREEIKKKDNIIEEITIMNKKFQLETLNCMGDTLKIIGQRKEIDELKEQVKYNV